VAAKATSPAPDSPLPFSSAADVRLVTMFIATDAPTPTLPPLAPASEGSASADTVVLLSATRDTSPFPLRWMEAFGPINADAWVLIKLTAKEPAIPTSVAPAPDVAVVENAFVPAPAGIPAEITRPLAPAAELPICWSTIASLVTSARFSPTATPTPMPESTAEPSATSAALLLDSVVTETVPRVFSATEEPSLARVVDVRSEIASAPTADTVPSSVLAFSPYSSRYSSVLLPS